MEADLDFEIETKVDRDTPKKYKVLLLNDDYTPMDFVVLLLVDFFNKSREEAVHIMLKVHKEGKAVVNIYPYEIANQKAKETIMIARDHGYPLKATIEEV